jgi:hypothetical protein
MPARLDSVFDTTMKLPSDSSAAAAERVSDEKHDSFVIDRTEFGIDRNRSSFRVTGAGTAAATLDAKIVGDPEIHERLTAWLPGETDAEHSARPWTWTLYPPELHVRACPLRRADEGAIHEGRVTVDDLDDLEVFLYAMSHHDVDDVSLRVGPHRLTARGVVCLDGRRLGFSIALDTE